MIKDTIIYTERLKEVPINMDYLDIFYEEYDEDDALYMNLLQPKNKEATVKFIEQCIMELDQETDLNMAILDKVTGEFIGYVAAYYINTREPELGLWIRNEKNGRGYGREALGSVIDWIRKNCDFDHIKSPVDKNNIGSRKIQEYFNGIIKKEYCMDNCSSGKLNIVEYWIK